MKQMPILDNVYTRVDVLDIVDNSFVRVASVYLLGEASKYVKSPTDINPKNKQLAAAIGINAIKALAQTPNVSGGDDWDELDDTDFEELLNMEDIPMIESSKQVKKRDIKGDHISSMILYTKDKLSDIADKIALTTNIKPYKQYLWMSDARQSLTGDELSLMSHWTTAVRVIDGYPIDGYRGTSTNHQSSIEPFVDDSVLVLTCISLDSVVGDKSKLQMIARSDAESFEQIYTNLIQRFFPMMTFLIFTQYLSDENQLETKFEQLEFDSKDIMKRHEQLDKMLPELNKHKQVSIDSSDFLTITTTGMILSTSHVDQVQRIDTMKLFQFIDIAALAEVAMIDLYRLDNEFRPVRIRKLPQRDQYRLAKDDMLLFSGFYSRRSLVQLRTMIITLLPRKEYELILIIVDQYGTVWIKTQPSQLYSFSKSTFLEFISPIIDPILKILNSVEIAFISQERIPLLNGPTGLQYNIISSSSKITFKFPVDYQKLLDLFADKLLSAGLIAPFSVDWNKRRKAITYFEIRYGVSRALESNHKHKIIEIKDLSGIAMVSLSNLDVEETSLYVDVIGRLIVGSSSKLTLTSVSQHQLSVIDPILYRPRVSSDIYSRICQKKFQPVITTKDDTKAVEYYNFTFNKPEYYKCPSKGAPVLGFIQNKHEKGFCLPCCRKTKPAVDVKAACINQTETDMQQSASSSTYKIDYPINEIHNSKIMHRRVAMPAYVEQLLGLTGIVANGTILSSHKTIQDGMDPSTKSYLQTAIMIASIKTNQGTPLYKTHRELIIDMIAMIKEPLAQVNIMRNKMVSERYITPQALIHAIEDQFLKMTVLDIHERLSAVEWNDLIIYLANCMGLNVLLLADERISASGIQIINLLDIDVSQPTTILLKRINLEWSIANHNTRALYLPITTSAFKVQYKSALLLERLDTSKSLPKIKRVVMGPAASLFSKQLTLDRLNDVIKHSKQYKLISDMSDQKVAVVGIGKSRMVCTISTLTTTIKAEPINVSPTASMSDILTFITDYNNCYVDETPKSKDLLVSYKLYLQAALKQQKPYEYVALTVFLLKASKLLVHDNMVIGLIVSLIDTNRVMATELMFCKPLSVKQATIELSRYKRELEALQSKVNPKSILCYPLLAETEFITWMINPLRAQEMSKCKLDMKDAFDIGMYSNEIYHLLVRDVVSVWKRERVSELDAFMLKEIKKLGSPPIVQTKVDSLITRLCDQYASYDPIIVRSVVVHLFEQINSVGRTLNDAIAQYKASEDFVGFQLKNIHRMQRDMLQRKINSIVNDLTTKTKTYPSFDIDISAADQRNVFYKNSKLLIHSSMFDDLKEMLLSDLTNPFRRDYIINAQLSEAILADVRLHAGELIYIQRLSDK